MIPRYARARGRAARADTPHSIIIDIPGLPAREASQLANKALISAKKEAPKLSGRSSDRFSAIWGPGYFGIEFKDAYVWFQEHGIRPFTMRNLAGKTIPMWIDDPSGKLASENPKAEKRTTKSGKRQVLIFRRAAKLGARKTTRRRVSGHWVNLDVPASYPGAPGRIASREAARPDTKESGTPGGIRRFNVGVRWRHPGLAPRGFLHHSVVSTAQAAGYRQRYAVRAK